MKGLDDVTGKGEPLMASVFPDPRRVDDAIPERARIYLCKRSKGQPPDGAAVLAFSAGY